MRNRLEALGGVAIAYVVAGFVETTLALGAVMRSVHHTLSSPILVAVWPLFLFYPENWLFIAIGVLSGLSVLTVLDRSRIPLAAPNMLPELGICRSVEIAVAFIVAEFVARFTAAAAFVLHLHLFEPYRGEPGTSIGATVALYRDSLAFFADFVELTYLSRVGYLLPEIGTLLSGGPNANHALREVDGIWFFDGVGFAIIVGYFAALAVSYVGVRVVSNRLRKAWSERE